jgi:small-conductance mechanosensitive channel
MMHLLRVALTLVVLVGGSGASLAVGQGRPATDRSADTTTVQQGPSGDAQLEQQLQAVFSQVEAFQGMTVSVQHGVAHLRGTVVDPQQATEAERLAQEFEGILYVENDVTADADLASRVAPAVSRFQEYGQTVIEYLPVGLVALFTLLVTGGLARWVGSWKAEKRLRLRPMAWSLVQRLIQVVMVLIGLVVTFDLLGVTSLVGALLGTAGVAGLVLGFAFQDIIENYLAGVLLSVRQPFRVNDLVSIDGYEGRVVRLTARELVLFTVEGNHVRLPNAMVFKNVLLNYTMNARRLSVFEVGVHPQEDLATVQRLGTDTLQAMKGILDDPPPFAQIKALSDSSVTVRYHGWVDQTEADFLKVQSEAIRLVKAALDEADIDLPEPTYRIIQMPPFAASVAEETEETEERTPSVREQARTVDVASDGRLEAQVDAEAHRPDEPNLLVDAYEDEETKESGERE